MEKEGIEKLQQSIDLIAKTTAYILENMATKKDLEEVATKKDLALMEFRLQTQISGIESDLKSFKEETRNR